MIPQVASFPPSLDFPEQVSVSFNGFDARAFQILEALREQPHIEKYRQLKSEIQTYIKEPFRLFRDDLVINWVLPHQLPFETERYVFSRLLKNDFGKGGCHHHIWLAFYRTGMRRLGDVQLAHTLRYNGFSTSLFIGENAPNLLRQIKTTISENKTAFLDELNNVVENEDWVFKIKPEKAQGAECLEYTGTIEAVPSELEKAKAIWWHSFVDSEDIVRKGKEHLVWSLSRIRSVWSLYRFLLTTLE